LRSSQSSSGASGRQLVHRKSQASVNRNRKSGIEAKRLIAIGPKCLILARGRRGTWPSGDRATGSGRLPMHRASRRRIDGHRVGPDRRGGPGIVLRTCHREVLRNCTW
jgi:hypothetical protein